MIPYKLIGLIVSIVAHGLLVLCLLLMGLRYPDPPPPELGVEMDMGEFSDVGTDLEHAAEGGEDLSSESSYANDDNNELTQQSEDVPLVSKKTPSPTKNKKKPKDNVKPQSDETKVDQNALFTKGRVKKGSGGSTGVGEGSGKGSGGEGGGSGISFSLEGRGSTSLPKPTATSTENGTIVVTIMVDQEGNVVSAKAILRGTTLRDTNLWRRCEQAAKKSKFTANPDAPELQGGKITYIFR
ncbi:MAG: hypothetical protein SPL14_07825 [Candidatus Onthomorpha sp.]|nr:hypothetical protein [Bacteroidales bacterium]MDD7486118.1 hypothetical protein [Bacteroidales bacterium]MDY5699319.1 hypothetical protein [Candidatus Onthomorpha sp.]